MQQRQQQEEGGEEGGGGDYNPLVMTKLLRNFRSHAALLQLPNTLFYGGQLLTLTLATALTLTLTLILTLTLTLTPTPTPTRRPAAQPRRPRTR